jgi:hypothetical protein
MKSLTIAILAAATLAFSAGCADIEPVETDIDADEEAPGAPLFAAVDEVESLASPYVGIWVKATKACDCPAIDQSGYTTECKAADCMQSEVLGLSDDGDAVQATVRYTALEQHLSAIGYDADLGSWEEAGGELTLQLESGETSSKSECDGEELVMGGDTLKHPNVLLGVALSWAWRRDQWIDVPYAP